MTAIDEKGEKESEATVWRGIMVVERWWWVWFGLVKKEREGAWNPVRRRSDRWRQKEQEIDYTMEQMQVPASTSLPGNSSYEYKYDRINLRLRRRHSIADSRSE